MPKRKLEVLSCGQCTYRVHYLGDFHECSRFKPTSARKHMVVGSGDQPVECPGGKRKS